MADSWEDKKKSRKGIGLIIFLFIVVIVIGFFVFNNFVASDQSSDTVDSVTVEYSEKMEQEEETSEWGESGEEEEAVKEETEQKESPDAVITEKKPKKEIRKKAELSKESLFSIDLPSVKCVLADKKGLFIQVSLKVYFKDEKLEREILFKRDNIKVVVKKTLFTKSLSEVVAEKLRIELKREINKLLEKGKITDIEFVDFRPVENL